VHTAAYVEHIASTAGRAAMLDPDTFTSPESYEIARLGAGAAIDAARHAYASGEPAFALVRPPGHHAEPDRAMGFCLFNSVAVAARALQHEHGRRRILIVDWDVHHGNGTQDTFYEDGDVYFLSLHQSPHYPGTGSARERGTGAGQGTTRNVELAAGTTGEAYRRAYSDALGAAFDEFQPDFVLVSAGFDCLQGDPLGGFLLEPGDVHAMTRELLERTRAAGAGGPVLTLEGGYAPARTAAGVVAGFRALAGLESAPG
jgi:acetoin utilization deacetylase AcuC-like enzyme